MTQRNVVNKNVYLGTGQRVNKPVWNYANRINYQNQFVPRAILLRSGKIPVSTAKPKQVVSTSVLRQVNTVRPKQSVNFPKNTFNRSRSPITRSYYAPSAQRRCLSPKKVSTVRQVVNTGKGNGITAVKPSAALKDKGIADSRCSRHMSGTKEYLSDYQEIKGRFVAFGKGKGRITGKECLVLSPNFKLLDESQVVLRIPRQNNMRLGHVNFKTMNKLVKGNLVRGLPLKLFENDHSCVACQKGKQHKATCKAKLVSSISQPLHILHMDLFGPTSVLSLNHKKYYLVVTDDFSRFSWVFFIATKDKTSGILKKFIIEIENQVNHTVKVIRYDTGTEFKNKEMNDFYANKGIRREFNNARTPQQNRAEAVNTACYVLNRVLVTKTKNKTPYDLINGRTPLLSFMRPFGYPVTILNTLDPLGKFEGKADEGFLVGYSIHSSKEANDSASLKLTVDAEHAQEDTTFDQPFFLLPLWPCHSPFSSKSLADKEVINAGKKIVQEPDYENDQVFLDELARLQNQEKEACDAADASDVIRRAFEQKCYDKGGAPISSSTKTFSDVHTPVNNADDEIPELVEINNDHNYGIFTHSSYDDENWDFKDDMVEGAVTDNNNMYTSNVVSSIPTTRVHSFHPKTQIISDPSLTVQTRSKIEPKKISEALDDESWTEAMQEELLQFKIQKVYKNKKDERGVVVRDKAKLVAQGHRQEEGMDYDEVFAHVARIEAIRIFLAFASFMGFIVYQMDIKSAFLYGTIEEEVYVSQPLSFVDPKFPNKVKQKEDGIFLSQDKYVAEILKKFNFENVKTASTLIETQKPLVKDEEAADVDVHLYRFQVTPKTSHLNAMKRIFSDYAGANLDKKSITRGCQFLGTRLIYWQCKKLTIVATSTTKAEYVAVAHFCGQVLWIQNQMLDYRFNFMNTQIFIDNESTISIVKNPVYHSKTKHIEIRHHFIRDSYEKKLIQVLKIHTDDNVADLLTKAFDGPRFNFLVMANLKYLDKHNMVHFIKKPNGSDDFHKIVDFLKHTPLKYALTHNPTIYDSLIKQFWQIATVRIIANGNQELLATINSKAYTITKASFRSSLQLADATCITNLPDAEIHEGLAIMGNRGPNPTPVADEATTTSVEVDAEGATTTTASLEAGLDSGNIHESPLRSHDAPLPEVNTSGSAEDSIFGNEVLTLKNRVKTLEVALKRKSKKVVLSKSEGEEATNSSKQERKSQDDRSEDFITPSNSREAQEYDISPTLLDAAKTLTHVAFGDVSTYKRRRRFVDTGMDYFSAAKKELSLKKLILKTKKQLEQEKTGFAEGVRLQAQLDAEVAELIYADEMIAKRIEEEAKLEANAELVKNMQGEDLSEEDFAKRMVDMVNQRKKYFAEERAKAKRSNPMTQTQMRTYMSNYLKNHETWKLSQLKKLTFEEIKEKFDKLVKQIDTFVPMGLEATKARMKRYSEELKQVTYKETRLVDDQDLLIVMQKVMEQIDLRMFMTEYFGVISKNYVFEPTLSEDVSGKVYQTSAKDVELEYPLSSDACQAMLDMKLQGGKQNEECYQLLKLIEKQSRGRIVGIYYDYEVNAADIS
ncbi:putative ribonuclease H-like domain-containing protein [Tanacetum coccineum]